MVWPKYVGDRSEPQRKRRCLYEALKPLTGAKTGSVFAPRLYPSPPKCGRRFGFAENGDSRVSYFTAPKGAWDILRTLRFTDFEADWPPATRSCTSYCERSRTAKKGALINKIATRPFRSELLSFLLHSVEVLYYTLIYFWRLWSGRNMPVAEANRKEKKSVHTKR